MADLKIIPHNRPTLGRKEAAAAAATIESGWVAPGGPQTISFEEEIAQYLGLGRSNVVAVSSGSAALYLALWALGAQKVLLPAYSCAAVTAAGRLSGSGISYLDSESETPNIGPYLDPMKSDEALVAISNFGIPAHIEISNSSRTVEDVSQAFGATLQGKPVGTIGEVGISSFAATKLFTTGGQGGIVFSNDEDLVSQIRDFIDFDMKADEIPRFNFQMTDIQSSVGRTQLSQFSDFLAQREAIMDVYQSAGLPIVSQNIEGNISVPFRAVLKVADPFALQTKLAKVGIKTIVPYESVEFFPEENIAPSAYVWSRQTLSLPIYPTLELADARVIANHVADHLSETTQ